MKNSIQDISARYKALCESEELGNDYLAGIYMDGIDKLTDRLQCSPAIALDVDLSEVDRLVFYGTAELTCKNEKDVCCLNFNVVVTPSAISGHDVEVNGDFDKHNGIGNTKLYLTEMYTDILTQEPESKQDMVLFQ